MTVECVRVGRHTLYLGRCEDVLPTLEADAVLADPPYGISLENHAVHACMDGSTRKRARSWEIANDHNHDVALAVAAWARKRRIPLAMFGSPYSPYPGKWRNILAWDKGSAVGGGGDPQRCWKRTFELVYVHGNGPLRIGRDESVLRFFVSPNYTGDFDLHPAQKPVPLLAYLIRQLTDAGQTVCDPCMGSATTLVACEQSGRTGIGIEKDPRYFAIAVRRLTDAVNAAPLFDPPAPVQAGLFPDP